MRKLCAERRKGKNMNKEEIQAKIQEMNGNADDRGSCECRVSCKPYNELEATVQLMLSDDYKARFVAEYRQTKYRYERLKAFCNRIEAARMTPERDEIEEPKHDCPLELLRGQQRAMGEYLHTLEIRAVIEQIEL